MKKISVSIRRWRTLRKIKNQQGLSNFSKTIDYLINVKPRLPQESLQEIQTHVDELINAKNLEENIQNDDGLECLCINCGQPFKLRWRDQDEIGGLYCPNCGYSFNLLSLEVLIL